MSLLLVVPLIFACTREEPGNRPETADEWAVFALNATGSNETWDALPYLGFTFSVERDGEIGTNRKHLWNRNTGDYRVEWSGGTDSVYVVLFNTRSKTGSAYLNGQALTESETESYVSSAFTRYINDTYWLLMPNKLMDEGVNRKLVPDSSNAESVVLGLSFESVGLTPGDRYWVRINRESGNVQSWSYVLESNTTGTATMYDWDEYKVFDTPSGQVRMPEAKSRRDSNVQIITSELSFPEDVDPRMFTDGHPMLFITP